MVQVGPVQPPGTVQNIPTGDGTVTITWGPNGSYTTSLTPTPGSPAANLQTIEQSLTQALQSNATYISLPPPTDPPQVVALTRQVNQLIRQVLGILDATT